MKKILETLKQKFMNKFFWNLQIETVVPDFNIVSEQYLCDETDHEGCVIVKGTYLLTCRCPELRKRIELLAGREFLIDRMGVTGVQWPPYDRSPYCDVEELNEKLKICFGIDFRSDKRWTRRYYVKLG